MVYGTAKQVKADFPGYHGADKKRAKVICPALSSSNDSAAKFTGSHVS
jgi:hypothetical protein